MGKDTTFFHSLLFWCSRRKVITLLLWTCVLTAAPIPAAFGQQHTIYHFSPGDWSGLHADTSTAVLFNADRSQLTRLRIGNFILGCTSPRLQYYDWPVTLSLKQTDPFPFFINPDGRFNGGFEVDPQDFAYGGLQVNMQGHLQGTSGTVTVWMESNQPDGVRCTGTIRNLRVRKMSLDIPRIPDSPGLRAPGLQR
jgi:hypothetical protein